MIVEKAPPRIPDGWAPVFRKIMLKQQAKADAWF
jgi:hypothetical protein